MSATTQLSLSAIPSIPLVEPGDDLVDLILTAVTAHDLSVRTDDVLIVAQKIVSKSEGRYAALDDVTPSSAARELAEATGKDPRLVELILSESREVVRHRPGVIIVEHHSGVVMANAGIDRSNIHHEEDQERVLLLPRDCDASAAGIRQVIHERTGMRVAVIISDSVGRAWRNGTVALALGAAGMPALTDLRGELDLFGRPLKVSSVGVADQLASAAALLMGEGNEGLPAVIASGLSWLMPNAPASTLVRESSQDLFR